MAGVILCVGLQQEFSDLINNNHLRDRSQKINRLTEEVVGLLKNTNATLFLAGIREAKPRYVRDQLELIRCNLAEKRQETIDKALVFCLKNQLYSAVDFCDALTYFAPRPKLPRV